MTSIGRRITDGWVPESVHDDRRDSHAAAICQPASAAGTGVLSGVSDGSHLVVEKGQLIGGPQTLTWLWFFWHAGPALGILFYAYSELKRPLKARTDHALLEFQTLAFATAALFAVALLVTVFHDALPVMDQSGDYSRITSSGIAPGLEVLLLLALYALWRVSGFKKVLQVCRVGAFLWSAPTAC